MKRRRVGCARNSERNALLNVIRLLMLVGPVEANAQTPKTASVGTRSLSGRELLIVTQKSAPVMSAGGDQEQNQNYEQYRTQIFSFNWRVVQFPMTRHNNASPARVLFPALVMIGIVWDPAATRRLAIVILIIAIVCFSLALLFFLRRR
jgi:hypothetical protein